MQKDKSIYRKDLPGFKGIKLKSLTNNFLYLFQRYRYRHRTFLTFML